MKHIPPSKPPVAPPHLSAFTRLAKVVSHASGKPASFLAALLVVIAWVATGPLFDYSDTWQLVINTGTTVVTFLMVFLIQNTQTRDTYATLIKLNELIRATKGAHVSLLELEELSPEELEIIGAKYSVLAHQARQNLRAGRKDTDAPEVDLAFDIRKEIKRPGESP